VNGFEHLGEASAWLADRATRPQLALTALFIVAGLFAAGGSYKLRHPRSAAASAVRFRVVRRANRKVGYVLGVLEILTAALLLAWPSEVALTGAVAALVLSGGFVVVIARAMAAREEFPCNCLSDSDEPVSSMTLLRALAMFAAVILGIAAMLRSSGSLYVGIEETLVAAVLALFVVGITLTARASTRLLRHHRAITAAIDWEWVVALHRSQNPVDQKGT
jgi:cation transport ATPase